jgi:L-ascorbate metabolism protein UlaG (beta-lactamase superfamily)
MVESPRWDAEEEQFENPLPLYNDVRAMISAIAEGGDVTEPTAPIPVVHPEPRVLATPPTTGLRITWLGHSTVLIEVDGKRFLTDPVWGPRASPFSFVGPKRWYPPLVELEQLPHLDAVLISHDHYDHLDYPTIERMKTWDTKFVVPLGVGAHLEGWGVPSSKIIEMDWWHEVNFDLVKIVCSPARHASGRTLLDRNRTLWAGYALVGPAHRVYFSGDTGMFPEFADIGAKYGPFDVTMVEVGAYNRAWPDWHSGPEQAVEAHQMLRGTTFIPIHWGLFNLALHNWTEPVERTQAAAEKAHVRVLTPRPGESLEPTIARTARWWPPVAWRTATEDPIRSTGLPETDTAAQNGAR